MDASLSGEYAPLMHFINGLERSKTFFLINGLTLTGQQGGLVNLRLKPQYLSPCCRLEPTRSAHRRERKRRQERRSPLMAIKVGTEDKKKVYLAAGLGWSCSSCWCVFCGRLSGLRPPAAGAASGGHRGAPAPRRAAKRRKRTRLRRPMRHQAAKVGGLAALDPTLHPEIMRQAESLEYTGHGRNIFSQFSAPPVIPKPIAPIRQAHGRYRAPTASSAAAHQPRFYGYAAEKTGQKQVFLLNGDDIFIASEGDVVDRRYRVVKIGAGSVQVEDIPYHNTQTLPLRQ